MTPTKPCLYATLLRKESTPLRRHASARASQVEHRGPRTVLRTLWRRWWRLPQELQLVCTAFALAVSSLALSMLIVALDLL